MNEREAKQALLEFRRAHAEPVGDSVSAVPFGTVDFRELALARHLAVALLLEADPYSLEDFLDRLVWEADLSERSLVAARYEAGLPQPVLRFPPLRLLPMEP